MGPSYRSMGPSYRAMGPSYRATGPSCNAMDRCYRNRHFGRGRWPGVTARLRWQLASRPAGRENRVGHPPSPETFRLKTALLVLAFCLIAPAGAVLADGSDGRVARDLSASCAACHGTEGRSVGKFAALAGQDAAKLVESLKAFRDGTRPASVMHQHAKGYTDDEFALIADFFSRQSATGR